MRNEVFERQVLDLMNEIRRIKELIEYCEENFKMEVIPTALQNEYLYTAKEALSTMYYELQLFVWQRSDLVKWLALQHKTYEEEKPKDIDMSIG